MFLKEDEILIKSLRELKGNGSSVLLENLRSKTGLDKVSTTRWQNWPHRIDWPCGGEWSSRLEHATPSLFWSERRRTSFLQHNVATEFAGL